MSEETKTIVEIGQLTEYWPVHIRSYTDTFCYVYPVLYKQETEWNGNEWILKAVCKSVLYRKPVSKG